MFRFLAPAIIAACLIAPASAFAIVNIEEFFIGPKQDGLYNHVEASIDGSSGNTVKNSTSAEWLSEWQHGRHTEFLLLQYAYGWSNGQVDTNRGFAHLRHLTQVSDHWAVEAFAQAGRDPFARVDLRTLLGGGVRWTLLEQAEKAAVYLGLGAFYEHEKLSPEYGTTDPLDSRLWRANVYLVLKRQLSLQFRAYSTTYYQPAIQDPADFRLLEQLAASVSLYKNLRLKLSLDVSHDSRPPQGVKPTDVVYSTGITVDF
jgi:putative salt-induced outer membrane protein YdiY